jgi:GrpB-like predicted nucleotidyltransferase (UPF0157 family)
MLKGPTAGYCGSSASTYPTIREVLHTIGNIDFQTELELDKVEKGVSDEELKNYIKRALRAAHQRRRQPYVDLLNELQMQRHRQSFAA